MARRLADTLADTTLPTDALVEMERLNDEATPLHIWLRTRANQPLQRPWQEAVEEPVPEPPSLDGHAPPSADAEAVLYSLTHASLLHASGPYRVPGIGASGGINLPAFA